MREIFKQSPIILGTYAFGGWYWGESDDEVALDVMRRAYERGVLVFDTAPVYGLGKSETLLSHILSEVPREKIHIITKAGLVWKRHNILPPGHFFFDYNEIQYGRNHSFEPFPVHRCLSFESVLKECDESLNRLRTGYIDLYLLHFPDPSTPVRETAEALVRLKHEGKIRYIGVSNHTVEQILSLKSALREVGDDGELILQERFNIVERKLETGILPHARKRKLPVMAYSPLAQGMLTGKIDEHRAFSSQDYRGQRMLMSMEFRKKVMDALKQIEGIRRERKVEFASLMIAWVLRTEGICCVAAGARNPSQLNDLLAGANLPLSEEEYNTMDRAFRNVRYAGH